MRQSFELGTCKGAKIRAFGLLIRKSNLKCPIHGAVLVRLHSGHDELEECLLFSLLSNLLFFHELSFHFMELLLISLQAYEIRIFLSNIFHENCLVCAAAVYMFLNVTISTC